MLDTPLPSCRHYHPAGANSRFSQASTVHPVFALRKRARPPESPTFEATLCSLSLRPDDSLTSPRIALSMGFRPSVSLLPAIQATGLLASTQVGLTPTERVSLRWTHSRTVEFLESGWRPWPIPSRPSHYRRSLSAGPHTPRTVLVCLLARHLLEHRFPGLNVPARVHLMPTMHREPLCPVRVLPIRGWRLPPPRKALPFPHRSYGLMRQTDSLPLASALASLRGSLQVAASPCWESVLPDVISASLSPGAWTPTPVGPYGAFARFFP